MTNEILLYTDGGCRGNQNLDGVNIGANAYVLLYGEYKLEGIERARNTTNNRMEIKAVINGLKQLTRFDIPVKIHSDSAYLVNCMQNKWYVGWINNNWRNKKKKPVENKELWINLLKEMQKFKDIEFIKVEGHKTNKWNNRCDRLVNYAMDTINKGVMQ